jgi:hypothetical protein
MARRSSTQTRQFAIGRFDMLRIPEMPSVVNFPRPLPRNLRSGAQPMRLGTTLPNPANSLLRRMISLFAPKNSLFSFEQGIRLQAVDPSLNLCADRMPEPAKTGRNLANSLLISLLSGNWRSRPAKAHSCVSASLEHFLVRLTPFVLSSPGLTGRSSKHRPWILDCQSKSDASDFDHLISGEVGQARLRVKPGNDTRRISLIEKRRAVAP